MDCAPSLWVYMAPFINLVRISGLTLLHVMVPRFYNNHWLGPDDHVILLVSVVG